jgi:hypothetical protein
MSEAARARATGGGSLVICFTRKSDGSAALQCTRADGSITWQRQEGARGRFFPLHDLTHLAVEQVLGFQRAFYGLVESGWNLTEFGKPWPRGPLPPEAATAELIVGYLDSERASGSRWSAEDFNLKAAGYHAAAGLPEPVRLTEEALDRIRSLRGELFARWDAVPAGGSLELEFPVPRR